MVYDPNKAGIWSSVLLQTKAADVDHVVEDALLLIPKTMVLLKARSYSEETPHSYAGGRFHFARTFPLLDWRHARP